jgi:hypothetical protein
VCSVQVQSEWFSTLYQFAQVSIPAQQVVDQLSTDCLFLTDPLATTFSMSRGERGDGIVNDTQHGPSRCANRRAVAIADGRGKLVPDPPSCRQVQIDSPSG